MKTFFTTLTFLCCFASTAADKGFQIHDLRKVPIDVSAFKGGDFLPRAEQDRISLLCPTCTDTTGIDIFLDKSNDGTESRYRSGETTIKQMEKQCQDSSPTCKLKAVEVGGAVGWVSQYPLGGTTMGSTLILFQNGDQLTIRSIAPTQEVSDTNIVTAIKLIASLIVGQ